MDDKKLAEVTAERRWVEYYLDGRDPHGELDEDHPETIRRIAAFQAADKEAGRIEGERAGELKALRWAVRRLVSRYDKFLHMPDMTSARDMGNLLYEGGFEDIAELCFRIAELEGGTDEAE